MVSSGCPLSVRCGYWIQGGVDFAGIAAELDRIVAHVGCEWLQGDWEVGDGDGNPIQARWPGECRRVRAAASRRYGARGCEPAAASLDRARLR